MKLNKTAGLIAIVINNMLLANPSETEQDCVTYCGESPHPMRLTARHIDPNGIGYTQGYTTVEGFFPVTNCDHWVLFLDVRGHVFNDGRPAANGGLGIRYLADSRVWGLNAYYDYRKTHHQHYNQVAMGLESLGKVWDFRVNGYLPFGDHKSHYYGLKFSRFKGHKAILSQKYEYTLAGGNAEAGAHVNTWKNCPLYFAGGPYYLTGQGHTAWGGQLRATITMFKYLELGGNVSYDHLFKWIGQGQVALNFPFGGRKQVAKCTNSTTKCSDLMAVSQRAYQPVDRFEIIPIDRKHKYSAAIDPATGKPYYFVFVNNTSSSNGTIKSPYPTLAAAQANSGPHNIIYVFPGDGTTRGMNTGIVLSDYQRLWGSSYAQKLPTTLGSVIISATPGSTINGVVFSPIITNTSGPVVTLGNGNEISGLYLQSQGSNPSVLATNVANVNLMNSTLGGGNAPGYIGISGTELTGTLKVKDCVFNQAQNGILLQNSLTNLTTNITNSTFSNTGASFPTVQWTLANDVQGNLMVNNSSIVSAGNGIQVNLSGTSGINAQLNNDQITSGGLGVYVNSTAGQTNIDVALQNNNMTTVNQTVYLAQTGNLSATLMRNQLFANSQPAFEVDSNAGSTNATVVASNNNFYSDNSNSVYLNQSAGNVTATINNNTMKGPNNGNGVFSSVASNSISHTLSMQGNTINVGGSGVRIEQSTGDVSATLTNNTIDTLGNIFAAGIFLNLTGGNSTELITTRNTIGGHSGLYANQAGVANLNITSTNNEVTTYRGYNLEIASGNTNLSMSGDNLVGYSPMTVNQTDGSYNATVNDSTFTAGGNTSFSYAATGGSASMNITDNTMTSGGGSTGANGSALYLSLAGGGTFNTSITDNSLNGEAFAVNIVSTTASSHVMNLSNNTVTTGGGFSLSSGATSARWMVNGNTFSGVGTPPVGASTTAGSLCMQLNNNTAFPITGAYILQNLGGTFLLNPTQGNIGQLTATGVTIQTCP